MTRIEAVLFDMDGVLVDSEPVHFRMTVETLGAEGLPVPDESQYDEHFFGRPDREKTCACERSTEPSVAQALYLINDQEIHAKLTSPNGRLARLLNEIKSDRALVEELYLSTLSRYPTADELKAHLEHVAAAPNRAAGMRDVLWALFNVREFVFNH